MPDNIYNTSPYYLVKGKGFIKNFRVEILTGQCAALTDREIVDKISTKEAEHENYL